jgi:hypothetical protein
MQIQNGHVASLAAVAMFWCASMTSHAQEPIDVIAYFEKARAEGRDGIARKTRTVDVRPSTPGEVIVTTIRGEGKETQSAPANPGDMVVRNRCPETGNEEILVAAGNFVKRYESPIEPAGVDGWVPYRPQGVPMRFVVVRELDGEFTFIAPWGEKMIARPGDVIVQDVGNAKDTYRIQKAAFACTYAVERQPSK